MPSVSAPGGGSSPPAAQGISSTEPPIEPPPPGGAGHPADEGRVRAASTQHAPHRPRDTGYSSVLANRHYRNVLYAQFVSNVGTWIEAFAIQMIVARLTGKLDDIGWLTFAQTAPIAILGLLGGVMADRVNRRTLLVVTQLIAGCVALGVAAVAWYPFQDPRTAVNWLLALGVLNGMVMAFNFPAWQVLTPRLVPREHLSRAIALNGIQFNLARVVGPALAGAWLARYASTPLFVFNALTFFGMALVVLRTPDAPPGRQDGLAVWRQILEAWKFIWGGAGPRAVFLAQVIISLLAAPLVRLLSLYTIDVYGLDKGRAEAAAGTLLAVQGVGAVLGGLALRYIPWWYPKHHFIPVAVTSLGMSIGLFSMTTSLWAGYAAMLVCGFFWIWSFNQSWAAMQLLAPDPMRGRILSLTTVASFGATAVGAAAAGILGESLKRGEVLDPSGATQAVVAALGVPLIVGGIFMLIRRTPEVDGMPRLNRLPFRQRYSIVHAVLATEHRPPAPPPPSLSTEPQAAETTTTRGL